MKKIRLLILTFLLLLTLNTCNKLNYSDPGKIYWVERTGNLLRKADLDGNNIQTILSAADGVSSPEGIAIDPKDKKVYIAQSVGDNIIRCNIDGSNAETIISETDSIEDCAVDYVNRKIYYTVH